MSKPAFPRPYSGKEISSSSQDGMSLLDWFAGQMAPVMFRRVAEANERRDPEDQFRPAQINEDVSKFAFTFAEAMLKESERRSHEKASMDPRL